MLISIVYNEKCELLYFYFSCIIINSTNAIGELSEAIIIAFINILFF